MEPKLVPVGALRLCVVDEARSYSSKNKENDKSQRRPMRDSDIKRHSESKKRDDDRIGRDVVPRGIVILLGAFRRVLAVVPFPMG